MKNWTTPAAFAPDNLSDTNPAHGEDFSVLAEESLVADIRGTLSPFQMVEQKLLTLVDSVPFSARSLWTSRR